MKRPSNRFRPVGIGLLLVYGCLTAADGPGLRVANRHLVFVQLVTQSGTTISPDLDAVRDTVEKQECKLQSSFVDTLPPERKHLAKAYAADYCSPWLQLWDSVLDRCDRDRPPAWCDDESAVLARLDLDGYFAALVAGIRRAGSALERDNIMDVVLSTFHAHVISDFGREPPDRWAKESTQAYLLSAKPEDAIALAHDLSTTWVGISAGATDAFNDYLRQSSGISEEQRSQLLVLLGETFDHK